VTRRLLFSLPLLLVALALGQSADWLLGLGMGALVVATVAVGPRWEVDRGRQLLSSAIGSGAGYVLISILYEPRAGQLGEGWTKLCGAALLAAAVRGLLVSPRGGQALTLAFAFAALAFAGKTLSASYGTLAVLFSLSAVWTIGAGSGRLTSAPAPRRLGVGAGVLALAAALGASANLGLHQLSTWARGRTHYSDNPWRARVGFSDQMDLGALDGLLDSDRRVYRIFGGRVDYLRGAALDVYEGGGWRRSEAAEREVEATLDAEAGAGKIRIESVTEHGDRFFIPLEARALWTAPSSVEVDALGNVRARGKAKATSVRLALGPRQSARPAEPRALDLALPRRIRRPLEGLAREWTRGAATPEARLSAIESHLKHEYTYARAFNRGVNNEPLLDFLFEHKEGHCEYFATALALLGRAAGVSTRLVMGYRVSERSPFGYWLVRDRNAHAWVEAWLPGKGWQTHDATPEEAQPFNRDHAASYAASSLDALGVAYDDATEWLRRRSLLETSIAWLLGCAVLAAIVARGVRKRRRRDPLPEDEALLPFMAPLLDALERRGHGRHAHEPLEGLAARLPAAEDGPARLLRRYSALRYGGIGDPDALAREVSTVLDERRPMAE
jgi:protein-glutamine gamma-glutamyltransferase